jgi:hypothetical protein
LAKAKIALHVAKVNQFNGQVELGVFDKFPFYEYSAPMGLDAGGFGFVLLIYRPYGTLAKYRGKSRRDDILIEKIFISEQSPIGAIHLYANCKLFIQPNLVVSALCF